ncbi:MAG: PEP-CTERM sorting domain-containing protein [Akkermansia sp.]|nr:PEP-CTERM sorting domain-containing protein [Akkermansia sp.]
MGIDIESAATVTFNTHNFTPDAYISDDNDDFGNYKHSHVIQLLGEMKGQDVNLIFNNELISAAAQKENEAVKRADGLGYEGKTGTEMGHVAIRDIHQFTGDITVKDMTALQVNQSNTAANAEKADIEVTVSGKNAALQFVDGVTDQYINQVNLEQGGHILLGGELQTQRTGWKSLDQTQVEVDIAHREGKPAGSINNLDLVKDTSNKSISIGGTDATPAVAANVHITSRETAEAYNALELRDTHLQGSIVELHKACRLDIADVVVVDRESVVRASVADGGIDTSAIAVNPEMLQANLKVPDVSKLGNNVSTSVGTVVQMTFTGHSHQSYTVGTEEILVVQADQLQGVDVAGDGLTLQIHDDTWYAWVTPGTRYMAVQMGGGSGQFHYEVDNTTASASFGSLIGSQFVLQDKDGNTHEHLYWVTSTEVGEATGKTVSPYLLYFAVNVPEPATATLSLLALAGLCARRRRK